MFISVTRCAQISFDVGLRGFAAQSDLLLDRGLTLAGSGPIEEALHWIFEALETSLDAEGEDAPFAAIWHQKARIRAQPDDWNLHAMLLRAFVEQGRWSEADREDQLLDRLTSGPARLARDSREAQSLSDQDRSIEADWSARRVDAPRPRDEARRGKSPSAKPVVLLAFNPLTHGVGCRRMTRDQPVDLRRRGRVARHWTSPRLA